LLVKAAPGAECLTDKCSQEGGIALGHIPQTNVAACTSSTSYSLSQKCVSRRELSRELRRGPQMGTSVR
jgi:hypothetical protein